MCRADAAIQTLYWKPTQRVPAPNFDTPHECLNWNNLDSWAATRMVDIFDPEMLVHPTLGGFPGLGQLDVAQFVNDRLGQVFPEDGYWFS